MKLSCMSLYALQALAHMTQDLDKLWRSQDIARAEGIPERFLLKVLNPLAKLRILHSLRGPNGGYRLARAAKDISVLDVIEAVEGPLHGWADIGGNGMPAQAANKLQSLLEQVTQENRQQLERVSIAQLAGKGK